MNNTNNVSATDTHLNQNTDIAPDKESKNKNQVFFIILLLVIAVLIGGIVGYIFGRNNTQNILDDTRTDNLSQMKEEAKTSTLPNMEEGTDQSVVINGNEVVINNDTQNISFTYPEDWYSKRYDHNMNSNKMISEDKNVHIFLDPEPFEIMYETDFRTVLSVYIPVQADIHINDYDFILTTVDEAVADYNYSYFNNKSQKEEIDINGVEITQLSGVVDHDQSQLDGSYVKIAIVQLEGKTLVFRLIDYKGNKEYESVFDEIVASVVIEGDDLKIDKITTDNTSQPVVQRTNIVSNGANLEEIKYDIPPSWEAQIKDDMLWLTPKSNGGYLVIKTYKYDQDTGRRPFYCETTGYCTDHTDFSSKTIGNISGYMATNLDNSGEGSEFFGSKGSTFYIISSFSPPAPNDFDDSFQAVVNSLQF